LAFGDKMFALLVTGATAGFQIQQPTRNVGVKNLAGGFMFQFVQTASTTAVTKRFPLGLRHFLQAFGLPERYVFHFLGLLATEHAGLSRFRHVPTQSTWYPETPRVASRGRIPAGA